MSTENQENLSNVSFLSNLEDSLKDVNELNFYRNGDNHAYIPGIISYNGECRNNLILSAYNETCLDSISNSLVLFGNFGKKILPLSQAENYLRSIQRILSKKKINYHVPETVLTRENLGEKNLYELKDQVSSLYGLELETITPLNSARTKNGIYLVKDRGDKKYVLKFRGRNKEKAELLAEIALSIPTYFPINLLQKNKQEFAFNLGGEFYGLEEFIEEKQIFPRETIYFTCLGKHIGLLHNELAKFLSLHDSEKSILKSKSFSLNESNLSSLYIDVMTKYGDNNLTLKLEEIMNQKLNLSNLNLQKQLVHGDLNHSNLIWQGLNPKVVDSESISYSLKVDEFESPLLFGGNMQPPEYIKGSLSSILKAYNKTSLSPISKEEAKIIRNMTIVSLIRNFVLWNIRRPSERRITISNLENYIKLLEDEQDDNQ